MRIVNTNNQDQSIWGCIKKTADLFYLAVCLVTLSCSTKQDETKRHREIISKAEKYSSISVESMGHNYYATAYTNNRNEKIIVFELHLSDERHHAYMLVCRPNDAGKYYALHCNYEIDRNQPDGCNNKKYKPATPTEEKITSDLLELLGAEITGR